GEPTPNHTFTLANVVNQVLPVYYFANDTVAKVKVNNTIKFTADMSDIYGTGVGFFDPNQDSILIAGLDWDNLGTVVSGDRKLVEVLSPAKRFKTTMTINGPLGDSTKWKFRAYPETRFTNTGWELGEDRWFKYVAEGTTVTLPEIKPNISPALPALTHDVTAFFSVDMNQNPKNKYNNQPIPASQIQFIGLKGGSVPIGNWGGNWVVGDTAGSLAGTATLIVLNDAGLNGDVVAGDKFWSRNVVFPTGTVSGKIEFKFAAMYPGADTVNSGASPLDNEGAFGLNHWIQIKDATTTIVTRQVWGIMVGVVSDNPKVKVDGFKLNQNYPNPFNPTTKFSYSVPVDGNVSLKLFNAMGEEVATIFNGFQRASSYDVVIDGYGLSSGVYFCQMNAGTYSSTIKMVLMK
ncbi:MAG: T9SS type A sorting domain-containing protein, partial [Ignavibacteriales bacterium]|nr:T9SS type A sorting domain-containing protein [Ignavibacteriales bacterium]